VNTNNSTACVGPKRRPLTIGLFLALAATGASIATNVEAATLPVTNCNDSGSGSLRDTVGAAMSGDTVDLFSQLHCSTITLTSGEIGVTKDDLSLIGSAGRNRVTIDGGGLDRVIAHYGRGTLSLTDLTVTHGRFQSNYGASGGCLISGANIKLINSTVSMCLANGLNGNSAYGGGIYTRGDLYLRGSTITQNFVSGSRNNMSGGGALGGGAYVYGNLTAIDTTISKNLAESADQSGKGGGLFTMGSALVSNSTISGNRAEVAAAWFANFYTGYPSASIINSTISGNFASVAVGGIDTRIPLHLSNSTIAFNSGALAGAYGNGLYSSGAALTLQSSIIADNVIASTGAPSDLGGPLGGGVPVFGANNLITSGTNVVFPIGTIATCPKLGPLADNGGLTQTHALLHTSFAIDTGNNAAILSTDQRGSTYPRVVGFAADIGAYEWQGTPDDRLFVSGFETACDH